MSDFKKIIADSNDKTVLCDSHDFKAKSFDYAQSEQQLEKELIEILKLQGYEYLKISNEIELKKNLKLQLEKLKSLEEPNFKFSSTEWSRFYIENFEGPSNEGVENRNKKIQGQETIKCLQRDDGTVTNITLIDKVHPQYNFLQVINQYVDEESRSRYDVTILVNGLPLVHIELKKRGISLKTAFNQITKYQKCGFHRLFEFIQIFVISNGTDTRYYSNTTRSKGNQKNSFLFTSRWSHNDNNLVRDLTEFACTFLTKKTLLDILTKYCVLKKGVNSNNLIILRPYQIAAIERIIERIKLSINNQIKIEDSGGYIWHTTGSGKTLTSFKAAQLATKIEGVEKVLFIVDRKDLDSQTLSEYKKFLGDSNEQTIDSTNKTEKLVELLRSSNKNQIIVTTIQKLKRAFTEHKINQYPEITEKRVVIIMDECHRSQTADTHHYIKSCFKKRSIFGFTGTPLFKKFSGLDIKERDEAIEKGEFNENDLIDFSKIRFGDCLHKYLIVNAIKDQNVLMFWVDYVGDREKYEFFRDLDAPGRVSAIVGYIIENFSVKTNPKISNDLRTLYTRKTRFNSMFAVSSISDAIIYYKEFKKQLANNPSINHDLKVAIIYSPSAEYTDFSNDVSDNPDFVERISNESQEQELRTAIKDFAEMFEMSNKEISFEEYRYQVSQKTKDREIDILIVVNMFLTGFDAQKLNTLWVDKNLEQHNLIQAFSRTNRILDETKKHGNIVCFRDLKDEVAFAIQTFAGERETVCLDSFDKRMPLYLEQEELLLKKYPKERELITDIEKLEFAEDYKKFADLANSLSCDERFYEQRKMTENQGRDYKSRYLEIYDEFATKKDKVSSLQRETSFNLEILRSEEINIDYIFRKLAEFKKNPDPKIEREIVEIIRALFEYRNDIDLIKNWMQEIKKATTDLDYPDYKKKIFYKELENFCTEEELRWEGVRKLVDKFLEKEEIYFGGAKIKREIMPNINVIKETKAYLNKWNKTKEFIVEIFGKFNFFKDDV